MNICCMRLTLMAMPLRSEEAEAAVGLVLGTVLVLVSVMWIFEQGIPRVLLATCTTQTFEDKMIMNSSDQQFNAVFLLCLVRITWTILVCRPCPISVPPWVSKTEPSEYTSAKAPAWIKNIHHTHNGFIISTLSNNYLEPTRKRTDLVEEDSSEADSKLGGNDG